MEILRMKSTELNSVFTEVIPGFSAKDVLNVVIFDSICARLGTFFPFKLSSARIEFTFNLLELRLIEYLKIGTKWTDISKKLFGRSESDVKNRFYRYLKKQLTS